MIEESHAFFPLQTRHQGVRDADAGDGREEDQGWRRRRLARHAPRQAVRSRRQGRPGIITQPTGLREQNSDVSINQEIK